MLSINGKKFVMQPVNHSDAELLFSLIIEMATYENDLHEVQTTIRQIEQTICNESFARAFIGYYDGQPVSYVIYFYTYSSYLGKPSIYIEDVYVKPKFRMLGIGKVIMSFMAALAIEKDCGRLDWTCLDWNKNALEFYEHMGAKHLKDRYYFRADKETLSEMAAITDDMNE